MRALRIVTTILMLLWGGIFMLAGSMFAEAADAALLIAGSLTGLTIWALYARPEPRPETQERYRIGRDMMLFFRGFILLFVWVIHLAFCMIFLAGGLVPLVLPSVLVFIILWHNQRLAKAPKKKKRKIKNAEDAAALATELRAHYALHTEEVDEMMQAFRRMLVEKYGMREAFVAKLDIQNTVAPEVPIATQWRLEGHTPEEDARKLIDFYYFSREANNPAIFTKHLDTGEDLPPDYDYDHWTHRLFGRSQRQKFVTIVLLFLLAGCFYGIWGTSFLASAAWAYLSLGVSVALAIGVVANLYQQMATGRLRARPGKRRLKKWDLAWMFPFAVLICWLLLTGGIGPATTALIGKPYADVYTYRKDDKKPCLSIQKHRFQLGDFCLERGAFDALPKEGRATFVGKKSWFGENLGELLR